MSGITSFFGETASSAQLKAYLEKVASSSASTVPDPEVKSYLDAVYFNYYTLGLSLLFTPAADYKPDANTPTRYDKLFLDSVDMFNTVKGATPSRGKTYNPFPLLPYTISDSDPSFKLTAETTGKDLVQALGEPTRKGGGAGPASGSIDIWCEWAKHGLLVEFGGEEARGPQAWERGKDAVWKVATLFRAKGSDG